MRQESLRSAQRVDGQSIMCDEKVDTLRLEIMSGLGFYWHATNYIAIRWQESFFEKLIVVIAVLAEYGIAQLSRYRRESGVDKVA